MPAVSLKNMDVDALLALRAEVERALIEQARDLQRQIALLGGNERASTGKRRGRPPGSGGRVSVMRGKTVPPKYRGPGGETWAGRGATPRWLTALVKEGHSIEEFLIGAGRKARSATAKKPVPKKRGAKPGRKPRQRKVNDSTSETAAAG